MKFKVVISTLWIDGVKYVRGDVVEMDKEKAGKLGTTLEPFVEEKKKPGRPKKVIHEAE